VYGSSLGQMLVFVVLVDVGFTVRFKVAAESQPARFVRCAVCVPLPVNTKLFHVYGSSLVQILILVVLVDVRFTVRFKVAAESHSTLFFK